MATIKNIPQRETSSHPHNVFLCRVASLPISVIEPFRRANSLALAERLIDLEDTIRHVRDRLLPPLHLAVKEAPTGKLRSELLDLKRGVFNLRWPRHSAEAWLTRSQSVCLDEYRSLWNEVEHTRTQYEHQFAIDSESAALALRAALDLDIFKKGLVLASPSLYQAATAYEQRGRSSRRAKKVELALLRYLTRTAMKTTPFGTFCTVVPGRMQKGTDSTGELSVAGDLRATSSVVRLNKRLLRPLLRFLATNRNARQKLSVEVNPLRWEVADAVRLLVLDGNRETFHRIRRTAVIEWLIDALPPGRSRSLAEIQRDLSDFSNATENECEKYVDRLLELGFLRFQLPETDQIIRWEDPVIDTFNSTAQEQASFVENCLRSLRRDADAYAGSDVSARAELNSRMTRIRAALLDTLDMTSPRVEEEPIVYEDMTAASEIVLPINESTGSLLAELTSYLRHVQRLGWPRTMQATMRTYYDVKFADAASVNLLTFYEDFFRDVFKQHFEMQTRLRLNPHDDVASGYDLTNPLGTPLGRRIVQAQENLSNAVKSAWRSDPTAEEIRVPIATIERIAEVVPTLPAQCRSQAVFAEWLPGVMPRIVLRKGATAAGYGKYFSRFVDMMPSWVTEELVTRNSNLTADCLAEVNGDAEFNANLHPPLVSAELVYLNAWGTRSDDVLLLQSIDVAPSEDDPYALKLMQVGSDRAILPVDLGFLNPRMRPALFQLLNLFSPVTHYAFPLPEWLNEPLSPGDHIIYRPRVVLGDHLVVGRRQWRIPAIQFPSRDASMSDSAYFLHVRRWRLTHGLPEEAYARIALGSTLPNSQRHPRNASPAEMSDDNSIAPEQVDHDRRKPQYVDFRSPMLVELFGAIPKGLRNYSVIVEEALPSRSQTVLCGQGEHVTELVLEVDTAC